MPPEIGPVSPWTIPIMALAAAYEVYRNSQTFKTVPAIDAPPRATPIGQWLAEIQELSTLMQRMTELNMMMRVYEMYGFTSLAHDACEELEGLQIQMATAANAYPIMGNRLEIRASAEDGSGNATNDTAAAKAAEKKRHQTSLHFDEDMLVTIHLEIMINDLSSQNTRKRVNAARIIRTIDPEKAKRAIRALITALKAPYEDNSSFSYSGADVDLKVEIADTLVHLGYSDEKIIEVLISSLSHTGYSNTALRIVDILGRIGPTAKAATPLIDAVIRNSNYVVTEHLKAMRSKIDPHFSDIGQKPTVTLIVILDDSTGVISLERKVEAVTELGNRRFSRRENELTEEEVRIREALLRAVARTTDASGKEADLHDAIIAILPKFGIVVVTPPRPVQATTTATSVATPKSLAAALGIQESDVQRYLAGLATQDVAIAMEVSGKCDESKFHSDLITSLQTAIRNGVPNANKALDRVLRFGKPDLD